MADEPPKQAPKYAPKRLGTIKTENNGSNRLGKTSHCCRTLHTFTCQEVKSHSLTTIVYTQQAVSITRGVEQLNQMGLQELMEANLHQHQVGEAAER